MDLIPCKSHQDMFNMLSLVCIFNGWTLLFLEIRSRGTMDKSGNNHVNTNRGQTVLSTFLIKLYTNAAKEERMNIMPEVKGHGHIR